MTQVRQIIQTDQDVWTIVGDTHGKVWVEEAKRLDYDQALLEQLLPFIPAGGNVVDAGAYIGEHAFAYSRQVVSKQGDVESGNVFAIEPNPVAFECLRRNCPNAHALNVALGIEGEAMFWNEVDGNYGGSYVSAAPDKTNKAV